MNNIFMIGNTHFDPVWTWKWEEAMSSIHSTLKSALDRMEEDADFIYSFSSPPVFEWIKKTDPEMFEQIKARVSEGRWELCEGWWVQPDCFSGCGESYARQSLYGQRYLMENFGVYSKSVFNVDSFGHNSQIPQILKKSHMKYYCMCRPEEHFVHLEKPYFRWVGKDGSSVRAFRVGQLSEIYNKDMEEAVSLTEEKMKTTPCDELMLYGVTNHGGAPTKKAIADIQALKGVKEYKLDFSTVEGYFEAQSEPEITVDTELITRNFGPYVNDHKTKKLNRIAEYAVANAEKAAVIAEKMLNIPVESEKLKECWCDVLYNQFHDILGGASIKEAYFDAHNQLGRAIYTANEMMYLNLQAVTNKIKTPGKNPENPWNLIVWNLNEAEYDGYLEGELQWLHEFPAYNGGLELWDEEGNCYPCQIILEKSVIPGFRSRVLFKATIPAMGYKLFKAVKVGEGKKPRVHKNVIETDCFTASFNEKTGLLESVYSKVLDKTFEGILKPQCFEDIADSECFNVQTYGEAYEDFELLDIDTMEQGEFRTIIRAVHKFRSSKLTLYYSFYKDTGYFDVRYVVNWNQDHTVLKFLCKTGYENILVASPFATEVRGDNESDAPMGEWACMHNDKSGVAFIADSAFAYTKHGDELGISILRSCIYADMRLDENPLPYEDYPIMEQGICEGKIRIALFEGDFVENEIFHLAKAFNNPPIVLNEANHDGVYGAEGSYVQLEGDSVTLSAVKKAEDGDGYVVRISEFAGVSLCATIGFFGKSFEVELSPYEIKTLKIKDDKITEINITED